MQEDVYFALNNKQMFTKTQVIPEVLATIFLLSKLREDFVTAV